MSRILVVGLISLLAGQALVLFLLASTAEPPPKNAGKSCVAASPPPKVLPKIMVAARIIETGTEVTLRDISWVSWPEEALTPPLIAEGAPAAATVVGMIPRSAFFPGEPIIKDKLMARGSGGALSLLLSPGMQASTIPIDETTGNAGMIRPGDHIDLILVISLDDEGKGGGVRAGETVLENLKVIAVDQSFRISDIDKPLIPRTVTLETTRRQASMIALAQQMGRIVLSVRASSGPLAASGPGRMALPADPPGPMWGGDVAQGLAPFLRRALPIKIPDLAPPSLAPPSLAPPEQAQTAAAAPKPSVLVIRGRESKVQQIDADSFLESTSTIPPPAPPTP